jgi:E3 ubiquitin-protein ligase BRE1
VAAIEMSAYQGKFEEMQRQIESSYKMIYTWIEKYKDQMKKNDELRIFFELSQQFGGKELDQENGDAIHSYLGSISGDVESKMFDISTLTSSKNDSALTLQIASLKSDLAGCKSKEQALLTEITKLKQENASLREDSDAFWKEMDSVSEAYEASREQNTNLLFVISKRDEDNARLLSEAVEAERAKALMEEQRDDASRKLKIAQDELSEIERRCKSLDGRLQAMLKEKDAHQTERRETQSEIDSLSGQLKEVKSTCDKFKLELDVKGKAVSNLEAEREGHLMALRQEKTRADRAELILSGKKGFKNLTDEDAERTALRKMVNCSVCSTRLKDRIITKCNHLFCSACVEANLSSRHRKCPGCGERFGVGDVKPFYFT